MKAEVQDILTKLIISIVIGLIIGGEREYRNKSAGLRTIILICLGSTLFTILSGEIGDATGSSRIAANIVTGIGFLGAGAIMREGLNISGLTTASTIWVAAALGMAVGAGEYMLAFVSMAVVLVILVLFMPVQNLMFRFLNRTIELHLTFDENHRQADIVEREMIKLQLKYFRKKEFRKNNQVLLQYDVVGKQSRLDTLITFLNSCKLVRSFDY